MSAAKTRSSLGVLVFLLVVLGGVVLASTQRQWLYDQMSAWRYQPSGQISTIRAKLTLTNDGAFYFNASQPKLETASNFNQNCQQQPEANNPILGCYVANRIYVFDVTNPELNGIEETTAAHELLHAVYQRLSEDEKTILSQELDAAYAKINDPDLQQRMAYYQKTEPGQKYNELHSILGSEYSNLAPALEAHYARYFQNRAIILGYHQQYQNVFKTVTTKLKNLSDDINSATEQLNQKIQNYNSDVAQLEADIRNFNERSKTPENFASASDFTTQRARLIARQTALDSTRAAITQTIDTINQKRTQYNKLVEQYNQLNTSINSSLVPTSSLK